MSFYISIHVMNMNHNDSCNVNHTKLSVKILISYNSFGITSH